MPSTQNAVKKQLFSISLVEQDEDEDNEDNGEQSAIEEEPISEPEEYDPADLRIGKHSITKVQIIRSQNAVDKIYLTMAGPSPHPALGYPAQLVVDTAHGYAEKWLRRAFMIGDIEVVKID